jgi:hypothetical protein
VPECNYEWKIMNYEFGCFGIVALTKAMQNTTDVCGLLQKPLIRSNENKIFSLIMKLNRSCDWGL